MMKKILRKLFDNGKTYFLFYLCWILLINCFAFPLFGIEEANAEPVFSVTSDNEPLNEILVKISRSTGYKIEITKGLENKQITVKLKKIALEEGLREIMRIAGETNYAILVNDDMKKVEVRIFDDSLPGQKKGGNIYIGNRSGLRQKEKAGVERDLMNMNAEKTGRHEEPPETDIEPPDIDLKNPD